MYPLQKYSPASDNLISCSVCVKDSPTERVVIFSTVILLLHSTTAIACSSTLSADTVQVKSMLSPIVNVPSEETTVIVGGDTE